MLHCYIPAWTVFCVLTGVAAVSPLVALLIMSGSMEVSPPGGAQQGLHTNRSLLCCNPLLPAPHCLTSRSRVPGVSRPVTSRQPRERATVQCPACLSLVRPLLFLLLSGPPIGCRAIVSPPPPSAPLTQSCPVYWFYWSTRMICVDGEGRRSVAAPAGWRLLECL